jgi:hypothetical protein
VAYRDDQAALLSFHFPVHTVQHEKTGTLKSVPKAARERCGGFTNSAVASWNDPAASSGVPLDGFELISPEAAFSVRFQQGDTPLDAAGGALPRSPHHLRRKTESHLVENTGRTDFTQSAEERRDETDRRVFPPAQK